VCIRVHAVHAWCSLICAVRYAVCGLIQLSLFWSLSVLLSVTFWRLPDGPLLSACSFTMLLPGEAGPWFWGHGRKLQCRMLLRAAIVHNPGLQQPPFTALVTSLWTSTQSHSSVAPAWVLPAGFAPVPLAETPLPLLPPGARTCRPALQVGRRCVSN
jgi:hypothetical protein